MRLMDFIEAAMLTLALSVVLLKLLLRPGDQPALARARSTSSRRGIDG